MRRRVSRADMREGAHVVQAVRELDQQHPHVVGDRQQELAQVLRLLGLLGDQVELLQLGQALDQRADLVAEQLVDLGPGGRGILDRVVQQRRHDRRVVELEVGQDRGHFERMGEEGIARGPGLRPVRLHGVDVGAVEQGLVGVRVVARTRSISSYCRMTGGLLYFFCFNTLAEQSAQAIWKRSRPALRAPRGGAPGSAFAAAWCWPWGTRLPSRGAPPSCALPLTEDITPIQDLRNGEAQAYGGQRIRPGANGSGPALTQRADRRGAPSVLFVRLHRLGLLLGRA